MEKISDVMTAGEVEEDEKTKANLILTIDPSLYVHVKEATTAKSLWGKLQTMFDDSGFDRRISLLRNLISTRLECCDSMVQYVNQIIETTRSFVVLDLISTMCALVPYYLPDYLMSTCQ